MAAKIVFGAHFHLWYALSEKNAKMSLKLFTVHMQKSKVSLMQISVFYNNSGKLGIKSTLN